jgi:hypothetical protein
MKRFFSEAVLRFAVKILPPTDTLSIKVLNRVSNRAITVYYDRVDVHGRGQGITPGFEVCWFSASTEFVRGGNPRGAIIL